LEHKAGSAMQRVRPDRFVLHKGMAGQAISGPREGMPPDRFHDFVREIRLRGIFVLIAVLR
jgi:hypothetical protein